MDDDLRSVTRRKGSFLDTFKAVGASFFGVRGSKAYKQDVARLNPVHVIVAGILVAICFVITLLVVVRMVIR